jgi:hypothetical protein
MPDAPRHRLQGVLNRPPGCGRWAQKAKKILNRRNEPRNLLKTQGLTPLEAKNEPKSECEKRQSKRRIRPKIDELWGRRAGARCQVSGVRGKSRIQDSGFRSQESGVRRAGSRCQVPGVRLVPSTFRLLPSAYLRLHSAIEGSLSWRDSRPVPKSATRCHCRQGKEELVALKSERTKRGCL